MGFARVYRAFAERGLHEQVVFTGAGKLGLPDNAVIAFALGADTVNVGREAMLALGCRRLPERHRSGLPGHSSTLDETWLLDGRAATVRLRRIGWWSPLPSAHRPG